MPLRIHLGVDEGSRPRFQDELLRPVGGGREVVQHGDGDTIERHDAAILEAWIRLAEIAVASGHPNRRDLPQFVEQRRGPDVASVQDRVDAIEGIEDLRP